MDIGFETLGNATLLVHDQKPILATDPWLGGDAYFGSWTLAHPMSPEQHADIVAAPFIWLSHGHPDHLHAASLTRLRPRKILLADHVGGRIAQGLREDGYDVHVLPDRTWLQLSPRVRVLCLSNTDQDAILLVDINGRLVVNMNDAAPMGWARFIRRTAQNYAVSFLLRLSGYGDADMINFYDTEGRFIEPPAAQRLPIGPRIRGWLDELDIRYFIPFSSTHCYQRQDSAWANRYVTPVAAHAEGFDDGRHVAVGRVRAILPAFLRYDCASDQYATVASPATEPALVAPEVFGDCWSDCLEAADVQLLSRYFRSIEHLLTTVNFVAFEVGGKETVIPLSSKPFRRGIRFRTPRASLMTAAEHEIFDDLLIGNFMQTTLVGTWPKSGLYPDFTPYVTKYADNGRAKSARELTTYFRAYERRALDVMIFQLEQRTKATFRRFADDDTTSFKVARSVYRTLRR